MAGQRARDPLERSIVTALRPGEFVNYNAGWRFVDGLRDVGTRITDLIGGRESARATRLLELLLAGCYEKSEEVDDSSGGLGDFTGHMHCEWLRARQAEGADPEQTARRLLGWIVDDPYGYCHRIEKDAVKALDKRGVEAFERAVRATMVPGEGQSPDTKKAYLHRRRVEILKAICVKRRDSAGYAALCEADGKFSPSDCEALAELHLRRRKPEEALSWVDRGLKAEREGRWPASGWRLPDLRRQLLKRLGRSDAALEDAWARFEASPSTVALETLMKFVPRERRAEWHTKAMDVAETADIWARLDLFVEAGERDRLANTVGAASRRELADVSHFPVEAAAKALEKSHPELAAKLHAAMALRILDAKKSKYYPAALRNLTSARALLLRADRPTDWDALVTELRRDHGRKNGFMSGFEAVVAGSRPARNKEPSFLERAHARWGARV
jgi:hypothetical protein